MIGSGGATDLYSRTKYDVESEVFFVDVLGLTLLILPSCSVALMGLLAAILTNMLIVNSARTTGRRVIGWYFLSLLIYAFCCKY